MHEVEKRSYFVTTFEYRLGPRSSLLSFQTAICTHQIFLHTLVSMFDCVNVFRCKVFERLGGVRSWSLGAVVIKGY